MMKKYFRQIIHQFRTQPVLMGITIFGTALSIAFVMLFILIEQVYIIPFAPESHRERLMHVSSVKSFSKAGTNGSSSNGPMGTVVAKECFYPLTSAEAVTAYTTDQTVSVSLPGRPNQGISMKGTDEAFWKVFDFSFLQGNPYSESDLKSKIRLAVIDEDVARSLWGNTDVVGYSFELNHTPYKVCGVVRPVSQLATSAYAKVWVPYSTFDLREWRPLEVQGSLYVTILSKKRTDFETIRTECTNRVERFNKKLMNATGWEISIFNQPMEQEKYVLYDEANDYTIETDLTAHYYRNLLIISILLLIPAVNLNAMLYSRMRQRQVELGIRRTFGATRKILFRDLFAEGLIVSILGGIIGWIVTFLGAYICKDWLFADTLKVDGYTLMLLVCNWKIFLYVLCVSMILHILSNSIPVWRTVRMNIAETWGGKML